MIVSTVSAYVSPPLEAGVDWVIKKIVVPPRVAPGSFQRGPLGHYTLFSRAVRISLFRGLFCRSEPASSHEFLCDHKEVARNPVERRGCCYEVGDNADHEGEHVARLQIEAPRHVVAKRCFGRRLFSAW